jgi:hypothetical protein
MELLYKRVEMSDYGIGSGETGRQRQKADGSR